MRLKDDPLRTAYTVDPEIDLAESAKALVNVGSVGQPRDGNPKAAYVVYDMPQQQIELRRLDARMAIAAEIAVAQVVSKYEYDIWSTLRIGTIGFIFSVY